MLVLLCVVVRFWLDPFGSVIWIKIVSIAVLSSEVAVILIVCVWFALVGVVVGFVVVGDVTSFIEKLVVVVVLVFPALSFAIALIV